MSKDKMSRRDFLAGATAASAGVWLLRQEVLAQAPPAAAPAAAGPAIGIAVIGLGLQGKEVLANLAKMPEANVAMVCDTYEAYNKRALETAPKAVAVTEYAKVLENKDVAAVVIATPSHKHKEIALAALQAGKHVYCEAPLATTVDDARAIASAAAASKQLFQSGHQLRYNPLHKHVLAFIKTGVPGKISMTRAQWNKKQSWRRMAPTPEREAELNWKISAATSAGLLGEVGVHSIDVMNWYLDAVPVSVSAFGGIMGWSDGRDVADTVQAVVEYPGGIRFAYQATLTSSYEGSYESIYGTDSTVLLRTGRAWMFKEADSPMLGWEVYARKETWGEDSGIALVADSTKLLAAGKEPGHTAVDQAVDPLYHSLQGFLKSVREGTKPDAGPEAGYRAAVAAIKANEALTTGSKVAFQKEWFQI